MKRAALALVGLLAMALSMAAAQAQTPEQKSQIDARVIVSGEGSVTVVPDQAQIRSGVTTSAKTVKEASDTNAKVMTGIVAALLDSGIAQRDVRTSQFSIEPVYVSASVPTGPKLSGYRVSNQVDVKVREISQIGDILDRLVRAGATDIANITFLVSEPEKPLDQAREAAIANARHKAELYARAAGVRLGRVAWITDTPNYAPQLPFGATIEKPMQRQVPIERGEQTLRTGITVGFEIAQ
jgi:uncharacterized protein YggE